MDRFAVMVPFVLLVLVVWTSLPLLTGKEILSYRDIGTTQLPAWTVPSGRINPAASFGQPLSSDPNLLLRYPTIHRPGAIAWHQFVHWLILWAGLLLFLRTLQCSARASVFGACAFSLSGYVVSSASFLNGLTAIAWLPWVLWSVTLLRDRPKPWLPAATFIASTSLLIRAGEPTFAAMCLTLSVTLMVSRPVRLAALAALLVFVSLINVGFLREVLIMARDSYRVLTGYGFEQAMSASLHPARLLETITPFLFGRPDRIQAGAWWGFRVSRDEFPYVHSLALGIVPLALGLGTLRWDGQRRLWIAVVAASLLISLGGYLPGAKVLYDSTGVRALRYPVKAYLLVTLGVAVLGAFGLDDLARGGERIVARRVLLALGCLTIIVASVAWIRPQFIETALVSAWWDQAWRSPPSVILAPIIASLPQRLLFAGTSLLMVAWAIKRQHGSAILLALVMIDLGSSAVALLPRTPTSAYKYPSHFVRGAASLGRVYERAGKDLDAVRRGAYGMYPSNDISHLIASGAAQGWALTGAAHGMTYAYDGDSDGSYTWRNDLVGRMLDTRPWRLRLKWLRAGGVAGVIAYRLPEGLGVVPIARTEGYGVPNVLYRIEHSLPIVRRHSRSVFARSAAEAALYFERPDFDPRERLIVEGPALNDDDPSALVSEIDLQTGHLDCRTSGLKPGYIFIARSFNSRIEARVGNREEHVFPANVNLIAIPVPAGNRSVHVRF